MAKNWQPHECLALAVRRAARLLGRHYDAHLAPVGLRHTQFSLLVATDRMGSSTIQNLAHGLDLERTTLTRNLLPLERAGWIEVSADTADRRQRIVSLTKAGRDRLRKARPLWQSAQQTAVAGLGAPQVARLRGALERVQEGLGDG